ncbi:Laminin subunit alpha-2 [Colletotrichum aenigma]|uniref:Laminin subunit alpha-2 n=1 Tax=Colletotrichum aenigma TaxID=1215731 RepID=UPI001872A868|nr:Laminin subunit alpha-2 [Colletotrichum aenigma]KAF5528167.1 Laminin subunit alpha-2 [Colletotrichum aenigma]
MGRQEQEITDSSALRNEPERILDIDPAPGAPDLKRSQPAGQEVDNELMALLPNSLKDKNEATTQTATAKENLKTGKKMLESLETILATQENLNKELEEKALKLEKSLVEKDAAIKALEEAKDKAETHRNSYRKQLMTLRASDIMYKEHVVKVERDCDRYKEEATQLRSELENAKQKYDKDMQESEDKREKAVSSATKAHEASKLLHEKELEQMQQRIDEATTARDSEKLAMEKRIEEYENKVEKLQQKSKETADAHTSTTKDLQKRLDDDAATHKTEIEEMQQRIDEATNTHETEKQATEKRIDESTNEIKRLRQGIDETAATHGSTTKDLQKRIDDAGAKHKNEVEEMQQRIKDDEVNHKEKMDEMEQRLTTSKASYDAQLDDMKKRAENSETSHKEKVNMMQQLIENAKIAHREEPGKKQQSMDAAKAAHDAETDKLRIRVEDTKAMYKNRVGVAQKQLNDSKATHEDKVKEMQRQIDECNTARDKDAEEHEKEMKSMRDAIEEMRNTHWAAIETEKSSHGRDKQSLETTHYKEKGGYETALKNIKLEMEKLKKEHAAATHNAKEERHRLEQKVTGLEDLVLILSDSKLEVERHLEEERRDAALKSSHLERLQKDLADVELQRVDVGNQLVSIAAGVQVLKESLSTEMTETVKAEESLRLANELHTDAIFQWARLLFGPREFYSEHTLISAIGQGTQAAGHDHKPWLISESWTADQQYSEFPGHELGAVVSMLVQDLQDKVLGINVFHGLMRRLTRLVSRAPRVNTALIQWIIDHSNWSLSTVRPNELNIPARAAIWALADVLRRRWPSTGHIEDSHEVMQECWDLIAQHDPKAVDAEGLNAQGKLPMVLELLQDNNGSVIHIVKKPEWAWAVIMDMQRHTCAFVKENCLREVAMGNGIWDKEVKAGNIVIHLDMSKPECVDFYMEYWVFED